MKIIELFDQLSIPETGDVKTFNALPIPEYPNFRIAINVEGNPVLLLTVKNIVKNVILKNYRLRYLQIEQNVECKITEMGKSSFQTFTVITFTSSERSLQEYFLRISETLVKTLGDKPIQQQIIDSIYKFVEVFRALNDTPTNTVHGLWSELFLIESALDPKTLLNYWHNLPEEKYDFNSGIEKIEVKSNSNFERIHTFSSEQLHPIAGTQLLIASVFVRQSNSGQNIQQLINSITEKANQEIELIDKLNNIVFRTLGSSLEEAIKIKFDYTIARDSLRFYSQKDISKIEEINIPNEVSEVKYKSDLTKLNPVNLRELKDCRILFKSL